MHDTAVRANRNVNACLLIIFIAGLAHIDDSRRLAASDTLRFTRDADRAAADTNLDKISASLCKEAEAFTVHNITRTDLYILTEILVNVFHRDFLPFREALR